MAIFKLKLSDIKFNTRNNYNMARSVKAMCELNSFKNYT